MSHILLRASAEATAWIAEKLHRGSPLPMLMKPVLTLCDEMRGYDTSGRVVWEHAHPFLMLGWDSVDQIKAFRYVPVEVSGFEVFVSPDTVRLLQGSELTLETVQVSFPVHSAEKGRVLTARPRPEEIVGTDL